MNKEQRRIARLVLKEIHYKIIKSILDGNNLVGSHSEKEYRISTKVNTKAIQTFLWRLKKYGLIKRFGEYQNGYYEVTDKVNLDFFKEV